MKIKDLIIITIALFTISIATLNVINKDYTQAIYYAVLGFPVLTYVIIAMKHERRLENALQDFRDKHKINLATNTKLNRDLEELQLDFANQVKATDLAEEQIKNNVLCINYNDENLDDVVYIDGINFSRRDVFYVFYELMFNKSDLRKHIAMLIPKDDTLEAIREKYNNDTPFAEDNDNTKELYTCPECGEVMHRHTSKIWFCDNPSCHRKQWRIDKLTK